MDRTIAHQRALDPLWKVERKYILQVLQQMKGNRTQTAKVLDTSVRTLRNRLCQYRFTGSDVKPRALKEVRSIKA